jgi:hypothetical protein
MPQSKRKSGAASSSAAKADAKEAGAAPSKRDSETSPAVNTNDRIIKK